MKKWQKRLCWLVGVIGLVLFISLFYIKSIAYTPSTTAIKVSKQASDEKEVLFFKGKQNQPALIFYQGALVETASYSIWANKVAQAGFSVYLVKQPLNLAVFGQDKAEQIIRSQHLTSYVIGGHSLGGVIASRFARQQENQANLKGVFFLASYPDKKGSLLTFKGHVLSVTGSKDGVLNVKAYHQAKKYLPKQTVFQEIKGGNHAGFGSYGNQKGDNEAQITNDVQQEEVADSLINWLKKFNKVPARIVYKRGWGKSV